MATRQVVSFHYKLTSSTGETIDSSQGAQPLTFLEGGMEILPALETRLLAMQQGDKGRVELEAKDGYGEHDTTLIIRVARNRLPQDRTIAVGDRFQSQDSDGGAMAFMVAGLEGDEVILDGNHPLSGKKLIFDVEITSRRPATSEEMSHGHVHGPGGHHHH